MTTIIPPPEPTLTFNFNHDQGRTTSVTLTIDQAVSLAVTLVNMLGTQCLENLGWKEQPWCVGNDIIEETRLGSERSLDEGREE